MATTDTSTTEPMPIPDRLAKINRTLSEAMAFNDFLHRVDLESDIPLRDIIHCLLEGQSDRIMHITEQVEELAKALKPA